MQATLHENVEFMEARNNSCPHTNYLRVLNFSPPTSPGNAQSFRPPTGHLLQDCSLWQARNRGTSTALLLVT